MKFKVGDMVTPGPAFVGHRNVFVVEEENLINRSFKIKLFLNATLSKDNIPPSDIFWKEDELELIRTVESLKDASKSCFIEDTMKETARYYNDSEGRLPSEFFSRNFEVRFPFTSGLGRAVKYPREKLKDLMLSLKPLNTDLMRSAIENLYPQDDFTNPYFKHWEVKENQIIKEENEMYKILDIYETKQKTKINNIYNERIESLIEDDEIQKIIKEMENQVRTVAGERADGYCFAYPGLYEERTAKAIKELEQERDQKVKELRNKIIDIKALAELAPNYEEKLKILRDYEIIDKKKNIIL